MAAFQYREELEIMTIRLKVLTRVCVLCSLVATFSPAQKPPVPEQRVSTRPELQVWIGKPPGTEFPTPPESAMIPPVAPDQLILRNVTVPTLTVYLPKSGNHSKTAVIVVPGGGFRVLAISNEGYAVADWFSQHGITAFVLKYRVAPTVASDEEFMPSKPSAGGTNATGAPFSGMVAPLPEGAQQNAISDGIQAIKVVRSNAEKYEISPDRIVMVGFSAGGALTAGTMLAENAADRPNYVGFIYGGPISGLIPKIPANTPPAFFAVAENDPLAGDAVLAFFNALRDAKGFPELHVFRDGKHGFAMIQRNMTCDHWIDEMWWWMESYGLTKP
jgi:acetyl esterase/lipase